MNPTPGSDIWRHPAAPPGLAEDEVHVWRVPVTRAALDMVQPAAVLSDDERSRAATIRHDDDCLRFVLCRTACRLLLSRYMDRRPSAVRLTYSPWGKPMPASEGRWSFNVSHSGGWGLIAVARGRQVGVDIERIGHRPHLAAARRYLSWADQAALRRLPPALRCSALLTMWVRQEAKLKADGRGWSLRDIDGDGWTCRDLSPAPNYVAAVAAAGDDWRVSCWTWPWSATAAPTAPAGGLVLADRFSGSVRG